MLIFKNNENQIKIGISGVYKNIIIIIYIYISSKWGEKKISWEFFLVFKGTHLLSFERVKNIYDIQKKNENQIK